ncbi:LysR family transcriptional regulator [Microbacterium sp. MPKO10]|uniref:LysR family transcriptional regulator n=1 Tax=Microbacterium sp. MPKO10 TaxID=2989818 RepID=UPI002236B720|nr:LysR family transcriptional regulator [Microbacterium sp. MPKO10]MCW4459205.1 LysR family transcriptional regulator [Microbacterium sp. MPKO10]
MGHLETRELRYFLAVAEELHFGRAAERLGIAQPPLSRAIHQLETRLGAQLFERDRRGVTLTASGDVLAREARLALDAVEAASRRTRRAAAPVRSLVLATKAGASHDLLNSLLAAYERVDETVPIELQLCEVGEQAKLLRTGAADLALMHRPVDDFAGLDAVDIVTEGQVAILPAAHPLASREQLTLADVEHVPDLPIARWPRLDGTYPDGPGPEVRTQSQLAQLVALGRTLLVIPASSRAWQWPEHVAVPVVDAPQITTAVAWPATSRSLGVAAVVRAAMDLATGDEHAPSRKSSPSGSMSVASAAPTSPV